MKKVKADVLTEKAIKEHINLLLYKIKPPWWPKNYDELLCNKEKTMDIPVKNSDIYFDFWACQRPLTKGWGSGQVFGRVCEVLDQPDVAFGKTTGIPDGIFYVDKSNGYDWIKLPFQDNQFDFGYWDPLYDRLYKKEGIEIWRCCKRLAILHTHIWPISWLESAKREAMIAVTFGPMKRIRCLQVFSKYLKTRR